ncbi:SMP-30/gluconolactonase/LRE family protein [soil metagenome]
MKSINKINAELEFGYKAHLGEGPVWDEQGDNLWWVDILSGHLMRYTPRKKTNEIFDVGEFIGAAALRKKGGLVLALQSGLYIFDESTGEKKKITDPEPGLPGNRFNDGKCDPAGRFWAGTMAHDQSENKGSLYRLNTDLSVDKVISGVTISNGLTWNPVAGKFYYIDTPAMEIRSYDYDNATGELSGESVVRVISSEEGYPDGMTIDRDGFLWVALYAGGKVLRINPQNGSTDFEVYLPVPKPTSCTFGGDNLDELYITTCRENMSKEALEKFPLSGSLFRAKVPFRGYKTDRFMG